MTSAEPEQAIKIPVGNIEVEGNMFLPKNAACLIIFAHGSGSSRFSPRNQYVAKEFNKAGMGTLLFDLLTPSEEEEDELTGQYRFNISLLSTRLVSVTDWLQNDPQTSDLKLGYFGASTGAAAALIAAAKLSRLVSAVVSRGGRPDLAGQYLPDVRAPTLLLVGGPGSQAGMVLYCLIPQHLSTATGFNRSSTRRFDTSANPP
jgi:dienelactone hydrolase